MGVHSLGLPPRLMGLDYGGRSLGVAVSDPLGLIAVPLENIRRPDEKSLRKSVARLGEIIQEYRVERIILGYPLGLDGREGVGCEKVRAFRDRLLRNFEHVEVVLWDERLSSAYAQRFMAGLDAKKRARVVDEAAASAILQGYMDGIPRT